MRLRPLLALTKVALKGYFRNRTALFWNLLLPLAIMAILGVLNFGSVNVQIGVVDNAHNDVSRELTRNLSQNSAVKVDVGDDVAAERQKLQEGKLDLVVVLPDGLGRKASSLPAYYSQGDPQRSQVALAVMNRLLDQTSFDQAGVQPSLTLAAEPVQSRTYNYLDFLVPGLIALSIQQAGLFGVANVFVLLRQRGILRRLMATPMRTGDFLFSQIFTRLVIAAMQAVILLGVAYYALHFHFYGNLLALLLVAVAGAGIFIAIGFAISGFAKSEETAGPLTNLVALPLIFLSGIFFPRTVMPDWLQWITQYSPLTYVTEAMRGISLDGASLWGIRWDLIGIAAWLLFAVVLARRLFRWEATG
jgi:ABC-2 type transport system permease protein